MIGKYMLNWLPKWRQSHVKKIQLRRRIGEPRNDGRQGTKNPIAIKTRKESINKNARQQINKVVVQATYILNTVVILPQLRNEYGKKHIVAKDVVGLLVGDSKNNREFD